MIGECVFCFIWWLGQYVGLFWILMGEGFQYCLDDRRIEMVVMYVIVALNVWD